MPEGLATDTARAELLREAEAAVGRRVAPPARDLAASFLRIYAAGLERTDIEAQPIEDFAGAAVSLFELAQVREPGQTRVRAFLPRPDTMGWRSPHAIAEIVTDDMPFVVDSALAAFASLNRQVHALVHPIVHVTRDAGGRLAALGPGPDARAESMVQITFAGEADAVSLANVAAGLKRAMADVRAAVNDWAAMRARIDDAIAGLGNQQGVPADEADEARALLTWVRDENFVLLGYRRFTLTPTGIAVDAAANLGILREHEKSVFDALRTPEALPDNVRSFLANAPLVTVAKANMRATVHRPQHCDVIGISHRDASGAVTGGELFLGLFTSEAYNRSPRSIPILRRKVAEVLREAGAAPGSHDGRALTNILETYPRDELFQADVPHLVQTARGILALQARQRVKLFVRRDAFERFISALVFVPRDVMDTELRRRLGEMLARAFAGRLSTNYIQIGDAPLARIHYIIATQPGQVPDPDLAALERAMAEAARSLRDRLAEALVAERGEQGAQPLLSRWGMAFPAGYVEHHTAREAVADIFRAETALESGRAAMALSRAPGADPAALTLRLAHPRAAMPLSSIMPLFDSLGLAALEEVPHHLAPHGAPEIVLHVFSLRDPEARPIDDAVFPPLLEALAALNDGAVEADGFNRLVLRAGLSWRECWVLRALYKWCRQVGFAFSQPAVEGALAENPDAARLLIEFFRCRHDPNGRRDDEPKIMAAWATLLDSIASPDEDRILQRLMTALAALVRCNLFQGKPWLALKFDSAKAGDMPLPRPLFEIFVHNARMEGCHLRAGRVARGGIRWSDRREDFRTEILGLMKAQTIKNVVIVPTGAKGGFVLKKPPHPTGEAAKDREAMQAEGIACYRMLVSGMLDVTDNIGPDGVIAADCVRLDADDPYIVAAADKGTATFSDIANALSADYKFWLGDAFASGGSQGYDHKGMGITAKGAWVCIRRHFLEMGHDVDSTPFTVAGVGDMSGDVFGNGMLETRKTRLRAAFDHRHIFLDPDPDPEPSWQERARLFALPRSSWADYDATKISKGGGVFPRTAKTIALSAEARAMLGLETERADPATIMRAILKLEVDLLYFGGIGTYVKSSHESQAAAGDRANDPIRIDGRDIRARIVGEGANLGFTQAARIEAAEHGVRLDTDALHNSAGVDTSDHEVNIKILLGGAIAAGDLTLKRRDVLLRAMTDDVGAHVLRTNFQQALAMSLDQAEGAGALPAQARLIEMLEEAGALDRGVAGLPDAHALRTRTHLTRPELCVLMPYTKLWLSDALLESSLPDDPALAGDLAEYFPPQLREEFADGIAKHRLRRELVAMLLTNDLVNRMGAAAFARLSDETGADPAAIARAGLVARQAFGLPALHEAVEQARVDEARRIAWLLDLRRLQVAAARRLVGDPRPAAAAIEDLAPAVAALVPAGDDLGARVAAVGSLAAAPDILALSREAALPLPQASKVWDAVAQGFALDRLRAATGAVDLRGRFAGRAVAAVGDDLAALQRRLAGAVLAASDGRDPAEAVARFRDAAGARAAAAASLVDEAVAMPDLAAIVVAARALSALA
jgi:glutamate dehydrogenase